MMEFPEIMFVFKHALVRGDEWDELEIEYFRKFEEIWKEKEREILSKIVSILGENFSEKDINVYVVPSKSKFIKVSRPYPLILKLKEDPYFTVAILIHELVHRIMAEILFRARREISRLKNEAFTYFIEHKVLEEVFGKEISSKILEIEKRRIKSIDVSECCKLFPRFSEYLKFPIFSDLSPSEFVELIESL